MFSTSEYKSIQLADRIYRGGSMIEVSELPIDGAFIVHSKIHNDKRGFFMESVNEASLAFEKRPHRFVQTNVSVSLPGVLRGLHGQTGPNPMGKLVRCLGGQILDTLVDCREDSPTFGMSMQLHLDLDSKNAVFVPGGCLHGFVVTSSVPAFVMYHCTAPHLPQFEFGCRYDDPALKIDWGVPNPLISDRDAALPKFDEMLEQLRRGSLCH